MANGKRNKSRLNLDISTDCLRKANKLAKMDRRSRNNLLEVLIEREYQRIIPTSKAA